MFVNPLKFDLEEKRFYTRERIRGIRVPQLAKIPTPFHDWWSLFNFKKVQLFKCIESKGDLKDTHRNTQNAALNVALF